MTKADGTGINIIEVDGAKLRIWVAPNGLSWTFQNWEGACPEFPVSWILRYTSKIDKIAKGLAYEYTGPTYKNSDFSYDEECESLSRHFLCEYIRDHKNYELKVKQLAQHIQDNIEQWLEHSA